MADYWAEVVADSPVFAIKTEEASGDLTDFIGSKTGTTNGSPTYRVAGPSLAVPYGITYVTGSYHSFSDHADLDLGDGPFTVEGWFKRHDAAVAGDMLGKCDNSTAPGYRVTIASTDRCQLTDGAGTIHVRSTAAVMDDTNWHHFAVVRALATTGIVYIDGSEATTALVNTLTFTDNANVLTVGRRATAAGSFLGTLAGIAIYKSALSAARVSAHYAARDTLPSSAGPGQFMGGGFFPR